MKNSLFKLFATVTCSLWVAASATADNNNYVVHEWGTFTSVQGGNGNLLPWNSQVISELPNFVYNWSRPGMNRQMLFGGKTMLTTLQRLETPVIYFYASGPMSVDVNVAFPNGSITEWYPQATQLGPALPKDTNGPTDGILRESRAIWKGLQIFSDFGREALRDNRSLPQDESGSHYFAARETGANLVRADFTTPTNRVSELERFIFYRGAGSFKTPLHVGIDSNNIITLENTGTQPLAHLFLVGIHNGYGSFETIDSLAPGNSMNGWKANFDATDSWHCYPIAKFPDAIGAEMQSALTNQGLFPDEAKAMVNTWKDSWFTEDGLRVLYILPRTWTDGILPMTLNPQPKELTRVMVGRAEIITPDVAANLYDILSKAKAGDANARVEAKKKLKKLGRFAEPALQLANEYFHPTNDYDWFGLSSFGDELLASVRAAAN